MINIIIFLIILLVGFLFISSKKITKKNKKTLNFLWVYHLLFSILYYQYTRTNSADANGYWRAAKNCTVNEFYDFLKMGPGTSFMYVINYFPANILNLDIFIGAILYSFLGFIGFYFFYKLTIEIIPNNYKFGYIKLFPLIFFIPSLHFWSAGGKDTICFLAIGMAAFSIQKLNKRIILAILSLALLFFVRPHIFILFIVSFSFVIIFSEKIKNYKKLFISILLIGVIILLLPKVLEYINLESISIDNILKRSNTQVTNLSGNDIGSSIDISSYPFPLKVFTFLYRPLFFDFNGLFSLFNSFENLLLLYLTIKIMKNNFIASLKASPLALKMLVLFLLLGTLMFSYTLSNLGIILRMKNMFVPGFLIFVLWCLSYKTKVKKNIK